MCDMCLVVYNNLEKLLISMTLIIHHLEQYEGIYEILDNYVMRTISYDGLNETVAEKIIKLRPMPSSFVIFARTDEMDQMFKRVNVIVLLEYKYSNQDSYLKINSFVKADKFDIIERPDRWYLFYLDFPLRKSREISSNYPEITEFLPNSFMCCQYSAKKNCDCANKLTVFSE